MSVLQKIKEVEDEVGRGAAGPAGGRGAGGGRDRRSFCAGPQALQSAQAGS